jgi:hypothetical protein
MVIFGIFLAFSNVSAEVKDVKVELALDESCIVLVKYTNTSKAALNGTLTLNISVRGTRKDITDYKINLAPGKTEVIDTKVKVSGEVWVFVQTSFSGAGTGVAILVPADKTLKCPK